MCNTLLLCQLAYIQFYFALFEQSVLITQKRDLISCVTDSVDYVTVLLLSGDKQYLSKSTYSAQPCLYSPVKKVKRFSRP